MASKVALAQKAEREKRELMERLDRIEQAIIDLSEAFESLKQKPSTSKKGGEE